MSGLLYRLGALCVRRKYVVVAVWVVVILAVGGAFLHYRALTTNDIRLPGTGSQQASDLLGREFPPQQNGASPIVFHVATGKLTDPANERAVQAALAAMRKQPHVASVVSPFSRAGASFLSHDGRTAVAQVLLNVNGLQLTQNLADRIFAAADPARHAGIQVEAGGSIGTQISQDNTRRSEAIGIIAAVIILAFTFGAMVAAGLPIVTAVVGLGIGLALVGLLGHVVSIPTVAPKLATMLGLGVGIDYALFIVFRHRDQLHRGMPVDESVARTIATSGSAVVFAGATVIVALLALLVANVPILGAMGYAAALTVAVAVAVAITLVPALLALLGRRIDALPLPGRRSATRAATGPSVWSRWAGAVTRHPWVSLIAALLVLAPLIAPIFSLRLGQEDIGVTPTSQTQRRAFDLISAGLGPGANGPLLIATRFSPPAQASAAYTSKYDAAQKLAKELPREKRRLTTQAAALKRQAAALAARQRALTAQGTALTARQAPLAAQGAALQRQKTALLGAQARLVAEQRQLTAESGALTAEGKTLAAQGAALQAQIAQVQQELVATTDPAVAAQLQAQLATLAAQAEQVQAKVAAVQQQGAALARQGAALKTQGAALRARGQTLAAQGAALQRQVAQLTAQAAQLTAQGGKLKTQGAALAKQSAALKRQERRLERQAARAKSLRSQLTRLLTAAGGQPRATDPRMVRLQDALKATPGVVSVTPPLVNKDGTAAVLSVDAAWRPAAPQTAALVTRLRDTVLPRVTRGAGMTTYVGGVTAAYSDLATLIAQRLPLVIGTVLALSFVLLMVAFRSVLVPLKAVICNLLAVGASFGLLTAIFQWGWGLRFVGLQNPYHTVPIASYVPLLMFSVLFGLSTDYEVFLISQIFQSRAAGQSPADAVRSGVSTSARVITAAAFIMVTVFASFILNGDPVIKQFGVGLSLAIILDTTIVRLVIVPATMVLLGEWNWWLPRWLRWLPQVELPQEGGEAAPAPGPARAVAAPRRQS